MKKFYILALVAVMFAACATDATEDVAIEVPETLKVSFEESSRIQLDDNKTAWTKGDLVSVFYRSDANQQWKFQGKTGDREGILKRVSAPEATEKLSKIVAVYPYSDNYYINPETCNIEAILPAEQTYLKDSYGLDGNLLVSATEFNQLYLRNVCGWLKIQLKGEGQVVKKVTLKGNNGEQVAGLIYIDSSDATATLAAERSAGGDDGVGGTLVFEDTILTEVALNCPNGVTLGSESTAFYIALPPQEFSKGLTVEIEDSKSLKMIKSTDKAISIERNHIQPMAAIEYIKPQPNNEIWYTSSDGNVVTPSKSDVFGANIVSNTYENGKGIIKFDDNITSIGERAFQGCTSLTRVTIPDSVTEIGNFAFGGCSSLTSVTIPDGVTEIGEGAFDWCTKLTSVTIPDSVTEIGYNAFANCSSLTSVIIPDSVTSIGNFAFGGCSSLTSVTIPDSVTEIGYNAFEYCTSLIAFYGKFASVDNRCLVVNGVLNSFAPKGLTEYTIPDSVTEIGGYAFIGCSSITSVTIPDSVTWIGYFAFAYCTSLTSITIPDSVTEIGEGAFSGCTSLTSVTIPDSVTKIEVRAFSYCRSLTAFYGKFASVDNRCLVVNGMLNSFAPAGLTKYTIPDSVTSIGGWAFYYCTSLTSVTIPDRVTEIGSYAFYYCTSLTGVTIPNRVYYIGSSAFSDCKSLKKVYCKPTTPPWGGSGMFGNNASGRKIYVPRASVDAYKAAEYWSNYESYIEPYDF